MDKVICYDCSKYLIPKTPGFICKEVGRLCNYPVECPFYEKDVPIDSISLIDQLEDVEY